MKFVSGDILESDADVIVIPMNTMGVFGAGLAKQACESYPAFRDRYVSWCGYGKHRGGDVCWYHRTFLTRHRYIAGLCTKEDWREPSQLEWVKRGLEGINMACATAEHVTSVAIPKVGCGLGGLDWTDVFGLITTIFKDAKFDVDVYM